MDQNSIEIQAKRAKTFGLIGMIAGILSWLTFCSPSISGILIAVSLVLCIYGITLANKCGESKAMHIIGICFAGVRLLVMIFFQAVLIPFFTEFANDFQKQQDSVNNEFQQFVDSVHAMEQQFDSTMNELQNQDIQAPDSTFYIK